MAPGLSSRPQNRNATLWCCALGDRQPNESQLNLGRCGNLEYGFDLIPVFVQSRIEAVYSGGFDPVALRWNSSRYIGRVLPYIELAGGAVFATSNLPLRGRFEP
jgi:hypothetical protein